LAAVLSGAVVAAAAAAQTPAAVPADFAPMPRAAAEPAAEAESCPPARAAAPRIRVIVPPPEIIFRPCGKRCGGWFHHKQVAVEPCPAEAPPPAPAPAGGMGGMVSFNMTLAMPMSSAGLAALLTGLGPQSSALGLTPAGGILQAGAPSSLDAQILRALLLRSLGTAADGGTSPPATRQAAADAEAQLSRRLAELNARISDELSRLRDLRGDMELGVLGVAAMKERVDELEKRLKELERGATSGPKKNRGNP
jgi:hypothetical protein